MFFKKNANNKRSKAGENSRKEIRPMKAFKHTIRNEIGIHARPAGNLVKEAKKYKSAITINGHGKAAEATKLRSLMSLDVKCGDRVTVFVEGEDEEQCFEEIKEFFEANL